MAARSLWLWGTLTTTRDSGFVPPPLMASRASGKYPLNVFMVLMLYRARMAGISGLAKYRTEFSTAT